MFEALVEGYVGLADGELDDAIRASELERRGHAAHYAALLAVAETRGIHRADDHRSPTAHVRATCNASDATICRDRKLAHLLDQHPSVGDALLAGRISIDAALEIERVYANPRVARLLPHVLNVLLDDAEHTPLSELRSRVSEFLQLVDQDGAFADLAGAIEGRTAHVSDVAGTLAVSAAGGDSVTTMQFIATFESFVEGEYRADLASRREMYGDTAEQHPLQRTPAQRRYDALIAMAAAAAASPEGRALPEPTVHILIDERSANDALALAGITLPTGQVVELDETGSVDEEALLTGIAAELIDDPESFRSRRCETSTGATIHPVVALRALLTGHVRRVVVDSQGVVIDFGSKRRLFTGLAREAAMLLSNGCTHPGCDLPARWCEVDHIDEWSSARGPTDQRNGNVECGRHNRFKHRARWKVRRDGRGRVYHERADGTIVLPVGERQPDLSEDEARAHIRRRLAQDFGVVDATAP